MLVLLPPSETKRDGGDLGPLDLRRLAFTSLSSVRAEIADVTRALAVDADAAMRALKLGPRQAGEVERNRRLAESATMPAIDRYTGVLFDALDAPSLDDDARAYAAAHIAVHSALFGLVGALDPIPAYRLSHDSRLPGMRLKAVWREPIAAELAARRGLILDLRSEGYADLGPVPQRADAAYVRVVAEDDGGRRRALNHFNKKAKGEFIRTVLERRPEGLASLADVVEWAASVGWRLDVRAGVGRDGATRPELELVA